MLRQTTCRRGWLFVLGFLCLALWVAVFAYAALSASASEPCPPAGLEIPEEMVQPDREIRALRNDGREVCAVTVERFALLVARLEGLEVELGNLHVDLVAVDGHLTSTLIVKDSKAEESAAAILAASEAGTTGQLVAATEANGNVSHSDLWFLIGSVAVLVAAFALYRVLVFR